MKIIAIGWNYPKHNAELGHSVIKPNSPVIFLKPETAVLKDNEPFYLPDFSNDIQYETELVFRISKMAKNVDVKFASRYYDALGLGIDFTARDLQNQFKEVGNPWELCKAFDNSAPISAFVPISQLSNISAVHFSLQFNNKIVQQGCSSDMFFSIDEIIAFVSRFITLKTGDLIFTGTPEGVGKVSVGDHLIGFIEEQKMFDFFVK